MKQLNRVRRGREPCIWERRAALAAAAFLWLLGANIQTLAGLSLVATGLSQLFPLAAWGPKTQEHRQNRKRAAVVGVVMVILGEGMLMSDVRVKILLIVLAAAGVVALFAQIPRRFFEAKETSSSTFDDTPRV